MKRGFTLIELLIIMIVVGVLTAVGLPKYQRALERGRALEGLHNVRAAADYVNAKFLVYAMNGEGYAQAVSDYNSVGKNDLIKSRFFAYPTVSDDGTQVTIVRDGATGWNYSLVATSSNGDIISIVCSDGDGGKTCTNLDLTNNLVTRK